MPSVRDVLASKGSQVLSISPDATVLDAVNLMNAHKVGALVVMDGDEVVGMFTERDVLQRVVGAAKPAAGTLVSDVMTSDVICCQPAADLDDVAATMKHRRIRHLPVCNGDGRLQGMISMGDVNAYNASNQEAHLHYLSEYIYGRV
ncbi:MAG TPA: CBS domain-containing protein [Tepidisphaeraceae bacterium]|nr:CBS domain-containing protein [Tepidisphaeraceae bacterium]